MAKETYAIEKIKEIQTLVPTIKAAVETGDLQTYNNTRAEINARILMAIFGAEIVDTKSGAAFKFNKAPATMDELAELSGYLRNVQELEALLSDADDDIPGAALAIVNQTAPEKVNKKNLTEYLLTGNQPIACLQIGPAEVCTLASLSEKYRKRRMHKIVLISVLVGVAIAAGVTTTCIILHNKHKDDIADDEAIDDDIDMDDNVVDEATIESFRSDNSFIDM